VLFRSHFFIHIINYTAEDHSYCQRATMLWSYVRCWIIWHKSECIFLAM